jgi:tetraacyldisaccharide 4'-kinase
VHAVAGIGQRSRFFNQLRSEGIEVIEHPFDDHHPFQQHDLEFGDDIPILMTEKDAVKCKPFAEMHHWVVIVDAILDEALQEQLLAEIRQLSVDKAKQRDE